MWSLPFPQRSAVAPKVQCRKRAWNRRWRSLPRLRTLRSVLERRLCNGEATNLLVSYSVSCLLDRPLAEVIQSSSAAGKAALYVGVSTDRRTIENQVLIPTEVAQRSGWEIVQVFTDEGISGATGPDNRPSPWIGSDDPSPTWWASCRRFGPEAATSICTNRPSTRRHRRGECCSNSSGPSPSSTGPSSPAG